MRIGVFGLGEAGGLIAADLVRAGLSVRAFDPANVPTPEGVIRCDAPGSTVADANIVIALTAASDATEALAQAYDDIPAEAIYADFSTAAASLKENLSIEASRRHLAFADVALLSVVPGNGPGQ